MATGNPSDNPDVLSIIIELRAENQALKKENAEAKTKLAESTTENQKLRAENQRLSSELSKHQNSTETLDDEKQWILITVAQHADPVSARDVAAERGLHVLKVEQSLKELERDKYVHIYHYMGKPPDFGLAERGRKYLIANNLLGAVGNPSSRRSDD